MRVGIENSGKSKGEDIEYESNNVHDNRQENRSYTKEDGNFVAYVDQSGDANNTKTRNCNLRTYSNLKRSVSAMFIRNQGASLEM